MRMAASILEILSERFVKPSTSTPPSLRCYKLSFNDQIAPWAYVPLAFFYPNQGCGSPIRSTTETSRILEIALSKTLSYYYPFVGRLMDNFFVECNDTGVHFIEARIKCPMTEFLKQSNSQVKDLVFRESLLSPHAGDASLLLVQLSYFDCAGMAVSVCMSHKLGDASTLSTFIHDWAAMVHDSSHVPSPQLNIGASLFPPVDDPSFIKELTISRTQNPLRKFLFHASKIAELKDMAANSGAENPTRVEVVTALLYRCAIVSSRAISSTFRPAGLMLPINLRPVIIPQLSKDSVGNLVASFTIATTKEGELMLPELVSELRNAKVNLQNEYKDKAKANGSLSVEVAKLPKNLTISNNLDFYFCSSWCRFSFYDVDFGWGKPLSVSFPTAGGSKNVFVLMDTRNEGEIEAVAMLEEPKMSAFETNEELLAFASIVA